MPDLESASNTAALLVPIVMLLGLVVTVIIPFLKPVRRWMQPRLKSFVTEITGVNELRSDMNTNHKQALDAIREHVHDTNGRATTGLARPPSPGTRMQH